MPIKLYRISGFKGIDQSCGQNALDPGSSPDACNMDTGDGGLSVSSGFVKAVDTPVPCADGIGFMHIFNHEGGAQFIVMARREAYAYRHGGWDLIHTYETNAHNSFSCEEAQIDGADYLIIGCGEAQLIKYDGSRASQFGSAEKLSDIHVKYLSMYMGRLFSAGDPEHPNRLYWSQLPGSGRTIEDWGPVSSSPNVEGGHAEIGDTCGDPIVAITAMSNQLLIFKRNSLYRLIGDRPSNFTIERIEAQIEPMAHTSLVRRGNAAYYMTDAGLYVFNGVTSYLSPDAKGIRHILKNAASADCRAAIARDMLFFAMKDASGESFVIEYDLSRRAYMLRRGFDVSHLCALDGTLYMINGKKYVYRFGEGDSYDGEPILAWWSTPLTDLGDKGCIKQLRRLYMRGSAHEDAAVLLDAIAGDNTSTHRVLLPSSEKRVLEIPLNNEGRTFSLVFYNEGGGRFSLNSGVELELSLRRRTE